MRVIAFPIPVEGDVPPIVSVLFALGAAAAFIVLLIWAVRVFRNRGTRTDVFGPPVDRPHTERPDDTNPDEETR